MQVRTRWERYLFRPLTYLLLVFTSVVVLFPFGMMISNSLKTTTQFYMNPIGLPDEFVWQNYIDAFQYAKLTVAYPNSIFVLAVSVGLLVFCGLLAAYPIGRIRLPLNQLILRVFLAAMVIPAQVTIIPMFIQLSNINMINNLLGLCFVFTATLLPLTIFLYSGFMKAIPLELEQAATIDGCNLIQLLCRIIFPLCKNITATVIILTSIDIWKNLFYPLVFLSSSKVRTLPLALLYFQQDQHVNWVLLFAAMVMIIAPLIVVYLLMQKHIVEGILAGAVKG